MRPNGLLVLLGVVGIGMGSSVVFWRWQAPRHVEAARQARLEVPLGGEPRLEKWLEFGRGLVHNRLLQLKLDSRRPWLVTHVIEPSDDPVRHEIWGVDLSGLDPGALRREAMVVTLELPAARLLGGGPLVGDKSINVPRYRNGTPPADPNARAEYVIEWALGGLVAGLERDIAGASFEARVGRAGEER